MPQQNYFSPTSFQKQPPPQQPQYLHPAQLFQQPPAQHDRKISFPASTNAMRSPSNPQQGQASLLIALAEEYFDAAHSLGQMASASMTLQNVDSYERLIATGLTCLDSVLKNGKMAPRLEANVRLRYAGVLHEETTNTTEAETVLGKGIGICERNSYGDIKYSMQYLLAQVMAQKSPKSAMKTLDGYIADSELLGHYSWAYAFRFLRVNYALESGTSADLHAAVQTLQKISDLASRQGEDAIHLTASLVEAVAHLRSTAPDSAEFVQRAIAAARTHQLNVGSQIPQLNCLTQIVDVISSIQLGDSRQMNAKFENMRQIMVQISKDPTWTSSNDILLIPINGMRANNHTVSGDTRAVLGFGCDGRDHLTMSFMGKTDAIAIFHMLSGVVLLNMSPIPSRALALLKDALHKLTAANQSPKTSPDLLSASAAKKLWRGQLMCYCQLYMAFWAAGVYKWGEVKSNLDQFISTAGDFGITLTGPLLIISTYLRGVYYQGVGHLDTALKVFQNPIFTLPQPSTNMSVPSLREQDFSILAALSTLSIMHENHRQNADINAEIMAKLVPLCKQHPSREILAIFNIVRAAIHSDPPTPLVQKSEYIGAAIAAAQQVGNSFLISIVLSSMNARFFANVIGEQAEKSARAATIQAQRSGSELWTSVAEGHLARCLTGQGKKVDAENSWASAVKHAELASRSE
ncbi:cohesin loading factor [Amylocarpus encephaloides]|uniref:Cohesin loading factor n=1 Tax=Amylocarpus encephaloides TaxID=45428 RepID=A0A9P8C4X9_9HELO|nr:cohesin loading factor [Amylocarpus encephaloides]